MELKECLERLKLLEQENYQLKSEIKELQAKNNKELQQHIQELKKLILIYKKLKGGKHAKKQKTLYEHSK